MKNKYLLLLLLLISIFLSSSCKKTTIKSSLPLKNDDVIPLKNNEENSELLPLIEYIETKEPSNPSFQDIFDYYDLEGHDYSEYKDLDNIHYDEGLAVYSFVFNLDEAKLKELEEITKPNELKNQVIKRVLCIKEFRQALSFSIDRSAYCKAQDTPTLPINSIFTSAYIMDKENGLMCKPLRVDNYGYNLGEAKRLFDEAFDKAVSLGFINDTENFEVPIKLMDGRAESSFKAQRDYDLLVGFFENGIKGTKFEGHVYFYLSEPLVMYPSWHFKNGNVDILYNVGWTSNDMNPYALLDAYFNPEYMYDYYFDTKSEYIGYTLGDEKYKSTLYDLAVTLFKGKEIKAFKVVNGIMSSEYELISLEDKRISKYKILSFLESYILDILHIVPLYCDAHPYYSSPNVLYPITSNVYNMNNNIKYITYMYNDEEWINYINSNLE